MAKAIIAEVRGPIPADVQTVFDVFAPMDPSTILTGYGPMPAVVAIEDQSGDWDSIAESRIIRLSDGSGMLETLTRFDRPRHFAYTLSHLTSPLRFLVSTFDGRWDFEQTSEVGATPIVTATWRYAFWSRSFLTWPLAWLIVKLFWRPYMEKALALASTQAVHAYESEKNDGGGVAPL